MAAVVLIAWFSQPSYEQIGEPNAGNVEQPSEDDVSQIVAAIREFDPWEDTFAQWLMAIFSVVATGASILAVMLVRNQLALTRESNNAAIDAANAAIHNNEITLRTSLIQQRAWITFVNWKFTRDGDQERGIVERYKIWLYWRNNGPTPAMKIGSVTARANNQSAFPGGEPSYIANNEIPNVGPSGTFETFQGFTPEEIFNSQRVPIVIRAAIRYDTVFPELNNRLTDQSFEVVFIGRHTLADVQRGKIGAENFTFRQTGDRSAML